MYRLFLPEINVLCVMMLCRDLEVSYDAWAGAGLQQHPGQEGVRGRGQQTSGSPWPPHVPSFNSLSWRIYNYILRFWPFKNPIWIQLWGRIQRKAWCMVWGPMPELTITSPYVHPRVDSNTCFHEHPYARADLNPMLESTLSPSQRFWIWPLDSTLKLGRVK